MAEPYERGPGLGVKRLEDITNALIRDGAGLVSGLDEVSMWQQLKAAVRGHWREREQARKEASNLRAELAEVKAEVERLRAAIDECETAAVEVIDGYYRFGHGEKSPEYIASMAVHRAYRGVLDDVATSEEQGDAG